MSLRNDLEYTDDEEDTVCVEPFEVLCTLLHEQNNFCIFALCGLNADWSASAALIGPDGAVPNRTAGAYYIVDPEDGVTIELVRRFYTADDLEGDGNDIIEPLLTFTSAEDAFKFIEHIDWSRPHSLIKYAIESWREKDNVCGGCGKPPLGPWNGDNWQDHAPSFKHPGYCLECAGRMSSLSVKYESMVSFHPASNAPSIDFVMVWTGFPEIVHDPDALGEAAKSALSMLVRGDGAFQIVRVQRSDDV